MPRVWPDARHLPDGLGRERGVVVHGVDGLLDLLAVLAVDEEDGAWRDQQRRGLERHGDRLAAQHPDRDRLHEVLRELQRLLDGARPAAQQRLADGADAGALADDRLEAGVAGGGLDHLLAAHGEAEAADAPPLHVRTAAQPRHRGVDVRAVPQP